MITVNLYRPSEFNIDVQLPSTWNDLTKEEVLEICRMDLRTDKNDITHRSELFYFILKNRLKKQREKMPVKFYSLIDIDDLAINGIPLLDFLFKKVDRTAIVEHFIQLPGLLGKKVWAPAQGFGSITCGQFEDAEIFCSQFSDKASPDPLAKLAAVLWLPKNTPYIRFDVKKQENITYPVNTAYKSFLKVAPHRLLSIFTWYRSCSFELPKIFPTVHESHGEQKQQKRDLLAFTKCIHAGAGEKNGSRDKIRRMKLYEFMFDMEQQAIEFKNLKKQTNEK
jgi:hypothetical protein